MRLQRYRYRKGQLLAPLGGVVRDTRDDECVITDSCKRRTAALCTARQRSLQSTAWMERRRPTLPEESSERARGVLRAKRIKSFSGRLAEKQMLSTGCIQPGATRDRSARGQSSLKVS